MTATALAFSPTWTVFGPLSDVDPMPEAAILATCPEQLHIGSRVLPRIIATPTDGVLNLGALLKAKLDGQSE